MPNQNIKKSRKNISGRVNIKSKKNDNKYSFYIIDGTSSAGKSTICNYFSNYDYKCVKLDDIVDFNADEMRKINNDIMKNLKNIYGERYKKTVNLYEKMMIDKAMGSKKALLDHISQVELLEEFKKRKLSKYVKIILVYTNLTNLARNIESRRKEGEPRGVGVYYQFADKYIKANIEKDKDNIIDYVNKPDFIKLLLKYFKYEFSNKKFLINFADNVFNYMGIKDDKSHPIKLRDEFKYDYLINTTDKTKEQIFNEIKEKIN
jgi:adenylate kinase family enzyme